MSAANTGTAHRRQRHSMSNARELPANMIALGTLPQDKMRNAAGLYNLTRDLGGAIGLATIVTLMNTRLHFHWNRLIEDINPARASVQQFLDLQVTQTFLLTAPIRCSTCGNQGTPVRIFCCQIAS